MKEEAEVMVGGVGTITVEIAFAMLLRSEAIDSSVLMIGPVDGVLDRVKIGRKMGRERSSIN